MDASLPVRRWDGTRLFCNLTSRVRARVRGRLFADCPAGWGRNPPPLLRRPPHPDGADGAPQRHGGVGVRGGGLRPACVWRRTPPRRRPAVGAEWWPRTMAAGGRVMRRGGGAPAEMDTNARARACFGAPLVRAPCAPQPTPPRTRAAGSELGGTARAAAIKLRSVAGTPVRAGFLDCGRTKGARPTVPTCRRGRRWGVSARECRPPAGACVRRCGTHGGRAAGGAGASGGGVGGAEVGDAARRPRRRRLPAAGPTQAHPGGFACGSAPPAVGILQGAGAARARHPRRRKSGAESRALGGVRGGAPRHAARAAGRGGGGWGAAARRDAIAQPPAATRGRGRGAPPAAGHRPPAAGRRPPAR
jgi:hypothetical protein